ncbi:unnamed protein product [Gadus morhua 'NCC']
MPRNPGELFHSSLDSWIWTPNVQSKTVGTTGHLVGSLHHVVCDPYSRSHLRGLPPAEHDSLGAGGRVLLGAGDLPGCAHPPVDLHVRRRQPQHRQLAARQQWRRRRRRGGGSFSNITADYVDRVETYANGSLGLARLRLADAGFYVLTVTEDSGSSKDSGFVLKVNEVIYEDLQYLSVSALVLFCLAGLLMLSMWLLNRAYKKIKACRRRREQNGNETELQPL